MNILEQLPLMFIEDQQARLDYEKGRIKEIPLAISKAHVDAIKPWIEENGWVLHGEDELYLTSIVLHADHDVDFQEYCLSLMSQESNRRDLVAFLTDRVRVNRGQKQVYGTQVEIGVLGIPVPYPIEDQATVDIRRSLVGLPPLSVYLKELTE